MRIEVLHVPDCPNLRAALDRLRTALDDVGVSATMHAIEVATEDGAVRAGMRGSPTILVDGADAFPTASAEASLSCRLYPTAAGLEGAPSVAQLRDALSNVISDPGELNLGKASAVAAMSDAARDVHRWVLHHFVETGRPPAREEIDRRAVGRSVLAELTERDVIAFDAAGEVRAAYPFSPIPTQIRVTWDGGPGVYAMCAVDALGMSAMMQLPVTIVAMEPGGVGTVTVAVDGSDAEWTPKSAVVFAGATGDSCCPSADRTCGNINFFTGGEVARNWAAGRPDVTGSVLTIPQALVCGVAEFGALLGRDTQIRT